MTIAVFSDIHGNRQAFEACLADAARRGATRTVLLGDYVGYGGDPEWVTEKVQALVAEGAVALRGNHDSALAEARPNMNAHAAAAIAWTRGVLSLSQQDFLTALPLTARDGDVLFTHADASQPAAWHYVTDAAEAAASLAGTKARVVIGGHIHRPQLYSQSATGTMTAFRPVDFVAVPLAPGRRWHIVCGAVGQPRDGNPAAAYVLLADDGSEVTFCRVPYDIDAAAARITAHRLPAFLAERLYLGH